MPKALPAPGDASHVLPSPRDPIADHGYATPMLRLLSRLLRALFQFSKRTAGKATKFGGSGVKLLGVVGAARLECSEPAAESGELIRRQLGNSFGAVDQFQPSSVKPMGFFSMSKVRTIRVARESRCRCSEGVSERTQLMSAFGVKRTSSGRASMSANLVRGT